MFSNTCYKCPEPLTMRFYLAGKAVCAKCYFAAMRVPSVASVVKAVVLPKAAQHERVLA